MINLKELNTRSADYTKALVEAVFHGFDEACVRDVGREVFSDPAAYVSRTIDVSSYDDPREFQRDYFASEFMSKYPNLGLNIDRERVAMEKFELSEQDCIAANRRISGLFSMRSTTSSFVRSAIVLAKRKIERLLGEFSWDEAECGFGFGPGASVGLRGRQGDSWYKFGCLNPTSTGSNAVVAGIAIMRIPGWLDHLSETPEQLLSTFHIVEGNRITTVPKNAKTDRVIAIEPLLNMFVQRGIGSVIRRRLRRVDVNLNSQVKNQLLAKAGSEDGSLATIDLSAASDSISMGLVEELLPTSWVTAIKICRSPVGVLPSGEKRYYRKVSSMGNGFTFELESLIFWAIQSSVMSLLKESDPRCAVYGDDLILPTSCASGLIDVLAEVGFKTNVKKTFVTGPFRESCGKHYFRGVDVSPMYVRENVRGIERLFWFANNIKRLAHRFTGLGFGCDARFREAHELAIECLPRSLRKPSIPFSSGDGAVAGDFDEVCPRRHRSFDGYITKQIVRKPCTFEAWGVPAVLRSLHRLQSISASFSDYSGQIADLYTYDPGENLDKIPLSRFKLTQVKGLTPLWEGLGPWVPAIAG